MYRLVLLPFTVSSFQSWFLVVVSIFLMSDLSWLISFLRPIVQQKMSLFASFVQLGAGLSVGLAGLAAGFAIGVVGDAGVRGTAQQPRLFVGMVLILIFAEVLGLYGLIGMFYLLFELCYSFLFSRFDSQHQGHRRNLLNQSAFLYQ